MTDAELLAAAEEHDKLDDARAEASRYREALEVIALATRGSAPTTALRDIHEIAWAALARPLTKGTFTDAADAIEREEAP